MATFVLIPGAGGTASYWHLVEPELRARGHRTIAVDLPAADDNAGFAEYADAVVAAIDEADPDVRDETGEGLVIVAQSMGGFTAPTVCQRVPVSMLVLVNAMIPADGETAGDWWANTGAPAARREQDIRDGRSPDADFDLAHVLLPRRPGAGRRRRDGHAAGAVGHPVCPCRTEAVPGRRCVRGCCPAAMTGSSRSTSSDAWPNSGWASRPTSYRADTWSRWHGRPNSRRAWPRTRTTRADPAADSIGS